MLTFILTCWNRITVFTRPKLDKHDCWWQTKPSSFTFSLSWHWQNHVTWVVGFCFPLNPVEWITEFKVVELRPYLLGRSLCINSFQNSSGLKWAVMKVFSKAAYATVLLQLFINIILLSDNTCSISTALRVQSGQGGNDTAEFSDDCVPAYMIHCNDNFQLYLLRRLLSFHGVNAKVTININPFHTMRTPQMSLRNNWLPISFLSNGKQLKALLLLQGESVALCGSVLGSLIPLVTVLCLLTHTTFKSINNVIALPDCKIWTL